MTELVDLNGLRRIIEGVQEEIDRQEEFLRSGIRTRASWERLFQLRREHGFFWGQYCEELDRQEVQQFWEEWRLAVNTPVLPWIVFQS
jgi:hypothetical protein